MGTNAAIAAVLQSEVIPRRLEHPMVSVIVPVRNGEHFLPHSLAALRASTLPPSQWELIVVDDSSHDRSAELAARYTDRLVRLTDGVRGPAIARNRGAAIARGDVLVFVDADVCIHSDALRQIVETLDREPDVSAVFGAYDLTPTAPGLVSQYRNLLHRYVHQRDAGDAVTFWAGCGAVRTAVFASCSGFDEGQGQEALEDVELGYRMAALGHRIVLRPEIQGTHLKRWTFRSIVVTDVRRRGIPWMRLLLSGKARHRATLNIRPSEQLCTLLVVVGCLALAAWLWSQEVTWLAVAGVAVTGVLVINGPLLVWFGRQRGWRFALCAMPLRLLYYGLNALSVVLAVLPIRSNRGHPISRTQSTMIPSRGSPD